MRESMCIGKYLHMAIPDSYKNKYIYHLSSSHSQRPCLSILGKIYEIQLIVKNIARIANAVPVTLYSRVTVNVEIVVLNCQKCNQFLKGHKSLRLLFEGVLQFSLSLSFSL